MLLDTAIAALVAGGAILGFAQSKDAAGSPMDHLHHSHYVEFAKVPETARSRMNPLVNDPALRTTLRRMPRRHRSRR